jgi:ABC-type branched-subunit amino acid transport system ATPase component
VLSAKNIVFSYGRNVILRNVSLSVASGETLVVMGGNGSGKSTLLRCLVGLEILSSGCVMLRGVDISNAAVHERRRLGLSYLFQGRRVFGQLTVCQNIALAAGASESPSYRDSLDLLAELSGGTIVGSQLAAELSGGQARILAIVCALALSPKVLLLDEPTENLSARATATLLDLLIRAREKDGVSSIFVTHSSEEAARIGTNFCRIEDGQVVGPVARVEGLHRN